MGTHTWFYRHVPRTQEEAKQSCLDNLRDMLFYANNKPLFERMIRMVEKDLCQKAVWNWQSEKVTKYINGKYYVSDTEYIDEFRVAWRHQEVTLFSLEETLMFIKQDGVWTDEFTESRIRDFWREYPDGMIRFG